MILASPCPFVKNADHNWQMTIDRYWFVSHKKFINTGAKNLDRIGQYHYDEDREQYFSNPAAGEPLGVCQPFIL
jgi:hypothetical protein